MREQGRSDLSGPSEYTPFIASDVINRHVLEPGQKVIFSVRRVRDQAFAENVIVVGERHNR